MKSEISKTETPITCTNQRDRSGVWHVIWLDLAPLILVAAIGVTVIALLMFTRLLIDPANFFLQQQIFTIVMITGLAVAIIAYTLTITRALRQIETWRQSGHTTKATTGLGVLTIVAIIIVLPVVLALFFH